MGHITKMYLTKKKDVLVHNAWENSPTRPEKLDSLCITNI